MSILLFPEKKSILLSIFHFFSSEIQHRKRGVSYQPQQPEFLKGFATLRLVRCSNYKFLELRKVTETKRFLRFDHQYGNNRELPYSRHLMRCGKAIGCFSGLYPWYQRVIFVTSSFLIVRGKPQQKPASRLICLSSGKILAAPHNSHKYACSQTTATAWRSFIKPCARVINLQNFKNIIRIHPRLRS